MPKDQRLYMTFPNDFHRHPKVSRLPVEARWAFVEMNGEARIADNDGVFTIEEAEFMWPVNILLQLMTSHPSRPLIVKEGDTYRIRDYSEHQQTKAEREALTVKRAAAGRAGAAAKTSKRQASAEQVLSKRQQTQAESESESESEIDRPTLSQSSHVSKRARNEDLTDEVNVTLIRDTLDQHADIQNATDAHIHAWARVVLSKARTAVRDPTGYAQRAITSNPAEVARWFTSHMKRNQP